MNNQLLLRFAKNDPFEKYSKSAGKQYISKELLFQLSILKAFSRKDLFSFSLRIGF